MKLQSNNLQTLLIKHLFNHKHIHNLKNHNLQVYVTAVTHSGDFENGFTTSATIMAPSSSNIARVASQVNDNLWNKGWDQRDVNGNIMDMNWMHA